MEDVAAVAARVQTLEQLTQRPAAGFAQMLAAQSATAPRTDESAAPGAPTTASTAATSAVAALPTATLGEMLLGPIPTLPWAQTPAPAAAAVTTPVAAPAGAVAAPGQMLMPVSGEFGSPFGLRTHPITGEHKMHQGVDIGAPEGAPISAAAAGKVTYSGVMGGYGNIVILDHGDGLETRYAHASSLDVRVGETVAAGQLIARVGSTGMSTGPHLHFEVRKDDVAVEPTDYINVEHHHHG